MSAANNLEQQRMVLFGQTRVRNKLALKIIILTEFCYIKANRLSKYKDILTKKINSIGVFLSYLLSKLGGRVAQEKYSSCTGSSQIKPFRAEA